MCDCKDISHINHGKLHCSLPKNDYNKTILFQQFSGSMYSNSLYANKVDRTNCPNIQCFTINLP